MPSPHVYDSTYIDIISFTSLMCSYGIFRKLYDVHDCMDIPRDVHYLTDFMDT